MRNKAFLLALLAVPPATALFYTPRMTLEQYEIPKQAALFAMIALMLASSPGYFSPRRWLAHPALAMFLAAAAVSTFLSISPVLSLAGDSENLEGIFTWTAYALLFLAGNAITRAGAVRLAAITVAAGAVSACYGLVQQAGADPFRGEYFQHVLAFAGNPDFLAQQMAMAIPLALGYTIAQRSLPGAATTALFICILFLTASRAGTLAGLAGGALLLWWLRRLWLPWKKILAWVAIPGLLAILAVSEFMVAPELNLRARLSTAMAEGGFSIGRGMMWSGVARVVRDHPLAGSGTDTLKTSFLTQAPPGYASLAGLGTSARKAHNEPLHFWATLGVLGLGAYIWLLACAAKGVRPGLGDPLTASLSAAISAYLLHNLFSFGTGATSPVFWLFLGFISNRAESGFPASAGPKIPAVSPLRAWTVAATLAGFFLAGLGVSRFTADGYAFRGNEATRAGYQKDSTAWFARAYRLAPYELTYLVRWAGGLEAEGENAGAFQLFDRAWKRNPRNGILLGNTGRTAFAIAPANDPAAREQALALLTRAVELAPTQPTLYGSVIMSLQAMGRMPERDAWIRKLQVADPVWAARLLGGSPAN